MFTDDRTSAVSVLTNGGGGTFSDRRDYQTGAGPGALEVGDLNGDGRADIATANGVASTVSVLINTGGGFEHRGEYEAAGGFPSLALGDVDGDGLPDLVAGGIVLLNRGGGTFATKRAPFAAGEFALGDLNGDGRLDVVTGGSSVLSVSVNAGGRRFAAAVDYPGGGPIAIGDLNGDGRADVVAYDPDRGAVYVLLNTPGLCNVQGVGGDYGVSRPLALARRILARGHCRVGKVKRAFDSYVKKGFVIRQKPGFGTVLPEGGRVKLVISKGKRK